jgi:predicted metal-dependent hydrolase
MKSTEKDEKFQRGISHFNAQEFFEAHEVWEEIWLVEAEPERTFLQGIIQIAAAFHHYCRENPDGAETLLAAGIVKLSRFPENHRGLVIADLRSAAKRWARSIGQSKKLARTEIPQLHRSRTLPAVEQPSAKDRR